MANINFLENEVIEFKKTTGENKNDGKNVALNDENVAKNVALKVKEKYAKLRKVYIDIKEMCYNVTERN